MLQLIEFQIVTFSAVVLPTFEGVDRAVVKVTPFSIWAFIQSSLFRCSLASWKKAKAAETLSWMG